MKHYLELSQKYMCFHKKQTRLIVLSVIMAVALVVGIFSMLDSLLQFEKKQVLKSEGNYHILVRNPSKDEVNAIDSRIDVENAGTLKDLGEGTIDHQTCWLGSLDEKFASNLNFEIIKGNYPINDNEIMLEEWFVTDSKWQIGDKIKLSCPDFENREFIISGIYKDWGAMKAAAIPLVFLSTKASEHMTAKGSQYFILFKDGVKIRDAENEIVKALNLTDDRIGRNEGLLALMMQTKNSTVLKMYAIGGVLFCLVLVSGVVMIYNTFHISVMERVRYFGLLRCMGATPVQIRKLVRKEGIYIAMKAIPFGVIAGVCMTFVCSAILKVYNKKLFGDIPYLNFSVVGIGAGVIVGFLTVLIASFVPAKKASESAPIGVVKGSGEIKTSKMNKKGYLLKVFPAEIALGMNNAFYKKKTLILMSSSIAFSIIMFLGFHVLINPKYIGMSPMKPYTPDITLQAEDGLSNDTWKELTNIQGIKEIHGRKVVYVEKTGLISYDKKQFEWGKKYLFSGISEEGKLNSQDGIIAVGNQDNHYEIGDQVSIETLNGKKAFTVMGIFDTIPDSYKISTKSTFITTEKIFAEIAGDTKYKVVDIQLNKNNQEQTINEIKSMIDKKVTLQDKRQLNSERHHAYMTIAVFIYGFIGVIALISILNIVNTMNSSIVSKRKYLGVMRALGMTGEQLSRMVLAESMVYCLVGSIMGCLVGSFLQKVLLDFLSADWKLPLLQIAMIFALAGLIAVVTVISPLKKIKDMDITEVIRT